MPNGIDLILADHERVTDLFTRFIETRDGTIIGEIIDALHAHDDAEHAALYHLVAALLGDAALNERLAAAHSAIKKQIDLVTSLEGPSLVDAVETLQAIVTDHVRDEETNVLPALTKLATPIQLEGLGARILQAKQRVG